MDLAGLALKPDEAGDPQFDLRKLALPARGDGEAENQTET